MRRRALSTLILLTTGGYILRKATMPGWWVWIVWVRYDWASGQSLRCTANALNAHARAPASVSFMGITRGTNAH